MKHNGTRQRRARRARASTMAKTAPREAEPCRDTWSLQMRYLTMAAFGNAF